MFKENGGRAPLYSVWDVPVDSPGYSRILDTEPEILASEGLCSSCFDIVINRFWEMKMRVRGKKVYRGASFGKGVESK